MIEYSVKVLLKVLLAFVDIILWIPSHIIHLKNKEKLLRNWINLLAKKKKEKTFFFVDDIKTK